MSTELRGAKVDMISTKNNDMKQRRVVNAAPAVDTNDYITKGQVDQSVSDIQSQIGNLARNLKTTTVTTSIIKPPSDSTTAIQVTKSDGQTPVMTIDTVNSMVGFDVSPPACKVDVYGSIVTRGIDSTIPQGVGFGRFSFDVVNNVCDLVTYNTGTSAYQTFTVRGDPLLLGIVGGRMAFFGALPSTKQSLIGYSPIPLGTFVGIGTGAPGLPYAQVNDLNTVRNAVENLRAAVEDLRTKLQASTLVG